MLFSETPVSAGHWDLRVPEAASCRGEEQGARPLGLLQGMTGKLSIKGSFSQNKDVKELDRYVQENSIG